MLNRRKRIIVHCHFSQTLNRIREILGRSVELVVAGDVPTLEAALRLYQQVAALIVEKKPSVELPTTALRRAGELLPEMPRIALVDYDATGGVHSAVSSGLITKLLFLPLNAIELASAIGHTPAELPIAPRLRSYPPLTGGMSANSSPSFTD